MSADTLAYEINAEVSIADGFVRGTILNRSDTDWADGPGDGELRIGVRAFPSGRVIGSSALPTLRAGQSSPFESGISNPGAGRHELWIEPYRENQYWFSDQGHRPFCLDVQVGERSTFARDAQDFGFELNHPYRGLPDWAFWKRGVAQQTAGSFSPVVTVPFAISKTDRVATAGSCFAQRLSEFLDKNGFNFFRTEDPLEEGGPIFSANYGNIYTTLQLRQLLLRAFGLLEPVDIAWKRADGRYIDPFRPQLYGLGYASEAAVIRARDDHFRNVRRVFTESTVFIFTLGLTETWINSEDGVALPVTPGAVAKRAGHGPYKMINLTVEQARQQLAQFIDDVRLINPHLRIVLTVSPVPLVATFENRHVLSSTTLSKAVLRAAADEIERLYPGVSYFPSYEIITGPLTRGQYFEDDLRSIRPEGVQNVMRVFSSSYLTEAIQRPVALAQRAVGLPIAGSGLEGTSASLSSDGSDSLRHIICDEEALEA